MATWSPDPELIPWLEVVANATFVAAPIVAVDEDGNPAQRYELAIIHPRQDDVRIYPLPAQSWRRCLGKPVLPAGIHLTLLPDIWPGPRGGGKWADAGQTEETPPAPTRRRAAPPEPPDPRASDRRSGHADCPPAARRRR